MSWAVAQLKPEPIAAELAIVNLRRQGYVPFRPTFSARRLRRNGRQKTIAAPVFPGYIFIDLNGLRWVPINSTYGIRKLLVRKSSVSEFMEPCPIATSFVDQLRHCCWRDDEASWCLRPGTRVTITRGALTSCSAIVTWSNEQRVRLLLEILGRDDVIVTVDAADVTVV